MARGASLPRLASTVGRGPISCPAPPRPAQESLLLGVVHAEGVHTILIETRREVPLKALLGHPNEVATIGPQQRLVTVCRGSGNLEAGPQSAACTLRFWARWVGFLAEWRGTDDVALRRLEAPIEKAKVVLLFVVYLYTDCDRREEKVTQVLSAVRHFMVTEHMDHG